MNYTENIKIKKISDWRFIFKNCFEEQFSKTVFKQVQNGVTCFQKLLWKTVFENKINKNRCLVSEFFS